MLEQGIPMTFDEYEKLAAKTAIYPRSQAIIYPALGLTGEAGEVAEKVKKMIRDGNLDPHALHKEIGDVLWYLSALCHDLSEEFGLNLSLSKAAEINIEKLADRAKRNAIQGNGDNR